LALPRQLKNVRLALVVIKIALSEASAKGTWQIHKGVSMLGQVKGHLVFATFIGAQLSPDRMGLLGKPPAWHSYRQEPVAVRAVALHPSIANAGMKQYECGRTQPLL
jgi:hypothetical protein